MKSWTSDYHERLAGIAALSGIFALAAIAYWWTDAPLYNRTGTIDAWLYTALFVNFDEVYKPFANTYYAARLPWIVPGRLLYGTLPIDVAYWVLHGLAFVGGVVALFVLVRRYLGLAAAVVGAAALALSTMYWNAQYSDYVDGVTITFLVAGLCFGLPLASGRRRRASLAAAGVFFAAAVSTNLFVAVVALIYPILYAALQPERGLGRRSLVALGDAAALVLGAAGLVISLGLYAHSNGGPFLYFEPQVNFAKAGVGETYKVPGYEWLWEEPRLLVPLFLTAIAVPFLVLGRRLPPFRFAAGSIAGLAFLTAVTYGWEFLAGGSLLEHTYYFSYLAISIMLSIASIAALAVSLARSGRWSSVAVAGVTTAAAILALGLIYSSERGEWTGRVGMRVTLIIMGVTAVLVIVGTLTRRTWVAAVVTVAAVGGIAFSSHFAIASSRGTFDNSASAPANHSLYHAALDHTDFVNRSSSEGDSLPVFWYRGTNSDYTSIQSMYFYAYTAISWDLPTLTQELRERLESWKPPTIVMLCDIRDCVRAATALQRGGYPYERTRVERITRGTIDFVAVRLERTSGS